MRRNRPFATVSVAVALLTGLVTASSVHAQRKAPVPKGYVLTHEHPMGGMAFGGNYAFTGKPGNYKNGIMERGYTKACDGCKPGKKCDHGEVKGNVMGASGALGADMGDHGSTMGPIHDSFSHLRYSTDWIKEAFRPKDPKQDARMRIMVAYAVESEAMCEQLYYANKGNGGPGGNGYACERGDSIKSLERQLNATKAWAKANQSWVEIAYSAKDLRRIVSADKLAVILGIESEYSFGAEDRTFDPTTRLQRYHDMGVRTFYLAHKINSRLAGADVYHSKTAMSGKIIRANQAISGCFYYDDAVGPFPLKNKKGHEFCDNNCGAGYFKGNKLGGLSDKCVRKLSEISDVNMGDYVLRGADTFNGFAIYPATPGFKGKGGSYMDGKVERNRLGLSHDGERVVRAAMMKGMMINIDHVSSAARKDIHRLATGVFKGYPLNAMHNNPNAMLVGNSTKSLKTQGPHEYDFDDAELDMVRKTGGFFGVRLGPIDSKDYPKSGVTQNCPKTATESAKVLAYLLDRKLPVGYSLDYATITQAVYSRTFAKCRMQAPDNFHRYGRHTTEGLSHIGMLPKWHDELAAVGLKKTYLDQLKYDGVAKFLAMWERSEAKAKNGAQIPRQTFPRNPRGNKSCSQDSQCTASQYCTAGLPNLTKNACQPKKALGKSCINKRQCQSNRCSLGRCAAADQCQSSSDCRSGQYCGDPVAGQRKCKALLGKGALCTKKTQCQSNRCSAGRCATADQCQSNGDCSSGQYCGDPVAGQRKCKALLGHGVPCTKKAQCQSNRCAWGFCADQDECRDNADCSSNQYCGDPVGKKRSCKTLKGNGAPCTKKAQCQSGRCSVGFCAAADACSSNSDCKSNEFCGDPIAGKRKCKKLLGKGKACTKKSQCASGKCKWFKCK